MSMDIQVFQSNHLQEGRYDPNTRTLAVQFTNGSVYYYSGIDPTTWDSMKQSSSPGEFFHSKIKGKGGVQIVGPQDRKGRR